MKLLYAATLLVLLLLILAFVVALPLLAADPLPYCNEDEAIAAAIATLNTAISAMNNADFSLFTPLLETGTFPAPKVDQSIMPEMGIGEFENGRWSAYVCGPALDNCK